MSQISHRAPPESNKSLEEKAAHVRSVFRSFGIHDDAALPILPIVEQLMYQLRPGNYEFGVLSYDELPHAEAIKTPDDRIFVREDVYEAAYNHDGRARFTLAHELGHLLLHPQHVLNRDVPTIHIPEYCKTEWQANTFASYLLMPRSGIVGLGVVDIMEKYGVSKQAAEVRLKK